MENQQQPTAASTAPASSSKPSRSRLFSDEVEAERVLQDLTAKARARSTYGKPSRLAVAVAQAIVKPATPEELAAEAARKQRVDRIRHRTWVDERLRERNVPPHYVNASLDDVVAVPPEYRTAYTDVCETLRELMTLPVTIALIGPRGPGKTHMACALVNAFAKAARRAKYLTASDYIGTIRSSWGGGAGADEKVMQAHVALELLVLDEFHERRETADEDLMLTRIVDKRYAANRATVLISNQDRPTFVKRVGTSIADRLNEGGIIECTWPSLRGNLLS